MDTQNNENSANHPQTPSLQTSLDRKLITATLICSLLGGVIGGGYRLGTIETRLNATELKTDGVDKKMTEIDKKLDTLIATTKLSIEYLNTLIGQKRR